MIGNKDILLFRINTFPGGRAQFIAKAHSVKQNEAPYTHKEIACPECFGAKRKRVYKDSAKYSCD